jgi:tetratricopeptide (TPR) repeat protein
MKPGRNDPCPCQSGQKYKNCCGQLAQAPKALAPADQSQLEALMRAGRYPELERAARERLAQQPDSGILWKLLGVSLALQDKPPLDAMANAARWLPNDAEAHSNLGNALRAVGRLDEAIASYRRALEIRPDLPKLNAIIGNTLSHLGRFADAVASYRRAIELEPRLAETHSNLGNALLNSGHLREAEASCRRALELEPDFAGAHTNLGNALREQRDYAAAIASHRRALEIRPAFAEAHINLGNALRDRGELPDAESAYRRALGIEPRLAVGHNNLGSALRDLGRIDEAEAAFRQALALQPNYAQAHTNLAIVLRLEGRFAEALSSCRQALEIDPRFTPALVFMGELEADKGEFSRAEQLFERALSVDENSAQAWAGICGLRKMTASDAGWLTGALRIAQRPLVPQAEAQLRYAIGKYFDDVQDYASAFTQYRQANELAKRYLPKHNRTQLTQAVNQTISQYNREWLNEARCDSITSVRPVFVVGMPRSGTTLAEQILASHPDVFGAGELPFWTQAAAKFETATAGSEPQGNRVSMLAEDYLRLLQSLSADALRTVDKMPTNFRSLGLICAALPNARIIHMRRNPIDTCLSIYFQNFDVAHTYGTDLEDLAHYYAEYVRLMEHWGTTLPIGTMLDVPYEALVSDPEAWSRKMLEFVGLPWDRRCLDFHQAKHTVSTRSRWQVRQKISQSSVERWRNYEQFIGPLLKLN